MTGGYVRKRGEAIRRERRNILHHARLRATRVLRAEERLGHHQCQQGS